MIDLKDFKKDPIKKASLWLQEAEQDYKEVSGRISTNRDHYKLDSAHLRARRMSSPERASLYMPEIRPAIDARVANLLDLIFADDHPYIVTASDLRPFYVDAAAKQQALLELQIRKGGFQEAVHNWIVNAELYPYSWLYSTWEEQWDVVTDKRAVPVMVNGTNLGMTMEYENYDKMLYAGPKWYALQPEDVRFDMTARHREDIGWFSRIIQTSYNHLRAMEKQGIYGKEAGGKPISSLKDAEGKFKGYEQNQWAREREGGFNRLQRVGRELEMVEMWFKAFDPDWQRMVTWRFCFVGDVPVASMRAPWTGVGFPAVLAHSRPLTGEVVGMSTADMGHSLQEAQNVFMAQAIEGGAMAIRPTSVYAGEVLSDHSYNPAAWIKMTQPGTLKHHAMPPPVWMREYIAMVQDKAKHVMNATEVMQALTRTDKEQTLGEYQGRRMAANKILGMNLRFYLPGLMKTAKDALLMSREELPSWIALAVFDDEPAMANLSLEELIANTNVDMPKIRMLANQEEEFMKAKMIYDTFVLQMNPFVYANPRRFYEISRRFLIAMGERDVEAILGKPPDESLPPMIQGGQVGQGQGQESLGGPAFGNSQRALVA